jgi:hypothetical protein
VGGHQTEGVDLPSEAGGAAAEEREEHAAVFVVTKERDAAGSACDDVEEPIGKLGAKGAGDGLRVDGEARDVSRVNRSAHIRHRSRCLRWALPG